LLLTNSLIGVEPNILTAIILGVSAGSVWLTKRWVKRWGDNRSMQIAAISMSLLLLATSIISGSGLVVGYLLLAGLAFCILSLAQIPWVLRQLPQPGLASGLYFGGMGLATAIISTFNLYY
jgi:hypothetical protein